MSKDLTVEDARALMLASVAPDTLGSPEWIPLDRQAAGRVLAEPIRAVRDQPPFDASAMDGYAVRRGDPATMFRVIGESAAGRPFEQAVGPGDAVRTFTGAMVGPGCAVIVQEEARREGDRVRFTAPVPPAAAHVRVRGGDFRAGETLLAAGTRLDAWRLALAASAGRAQALVARRPRVAILSTGEEVVRPGAGEPTPFQIFDSGGPALSTLIALWGGEPIGLAPAGDDVEAIAAAVAHAGGDMVVTVGGASVGDYDLVKPALAQLGLELEVERIKLRPGRPTWFGVLGDGRRVLGLPGNPASALVAAELFLRPMLAAWQGAAPVFPLEVARLSEALPETGPREHWMRARLLSHGDGVLAVQPFADQDSSLVRVFAEADALLRRPAGAPSLDVGARVEVLRLARL